jgi:hypothetical protein
MNMELFELAFKFYQVYEKITGNEKKNGKFSISDSFQREKYFRSNGIHFYSDCEFKRLKIFKKNKKGKF